LPVGESGESQNPGKIDNSKDLSEDPQRWKVLMKKQDRSLPLKELSRRDAVVLGIGSLLAVPIGLRPSSRSERAQKVAFGSRTRRLGNRIVEVQTEFKSQFLIRAKAANPTLHFTSANGILRLSSPAASTLALTPISDADVISSAERFKVARDERWVFEIAALARIEAGDQQAALNLLDAGALLTLREPSPNLRLLDLWAGLSARLGRDIQLVLGRAHLTPAETSPLGTRLATWSRPESQWRRRWSNKGQPVRWHHPFDRKGERPRVVEIA
jgi:hypothetical protein